MDSDLVNGQSLFVAALQRSGHHALIQWIMINGPAPACFLNDCKPLTNPYSTANMSCSLMPNLNLQEELNGQFSWKALLICSYEDRDLRLLYPSWFTTAMTRWIGRSARSTNVLVLRDPYNMIASKYYWSVRGARWRPSPRAIAALPAIWKAYAREFVGLTSFVPAPVLRVTYNQWFTDAAYRRRLAAALGISAADEGREMVSRWGPNTWGDSFDNMDYDGHATGMKVLERWRYFADDEEFRKLVQDAELIELSHAIFGELPGTDILLR